MQSGPWLPSALSASETQVLAVGVVACMHPGRWAGHLLQHYSPVAQRMKWRLRLRSLAGDSHAGSDSEACALPALPAAHLLSFEMLAQGQSLQHVRQPVA